MRLLPLRSRLRPLALWHIHLHARANSRASLHSGASGRPDGEKGGLRRQALIVDSLRRGVGQLSWTPPDSQWSRYEDERPTYSKEAWNARLAVVRRVLAQLKPAVVWDFGMAAGHFSREAADAGAYTVGLDADSACVDKAYREARGRGETRLLPLVQDLLRPTGPGGWAEGEILSLSARGPADLLLVLGLAHHLAVPGGVPLGHQLARFTRLGKTVLFELVPDTDPVAREWSSRFDIMGLDRAAFEASVLPLFDVMETMPLPSSERVLYLVRAR